MSQTVPVAVPRKGRPLEAVLERLAAVAGVHGLADAVSSTLRYEKAVAKGTQTANRNVYERLAEYSDLSDPYAPEYTLLRDDRQGYPRRVVFDSVTVPVDLGDANRNARASRNGKRPSGSVDLHLVGREEPFRALRTHDFALGFDSADLVLEEVVSLTPEGVGDIADVNARIDPRDTDVRVVTGLGDTVYHTLMATPETLPPRTDLDREFVTDYEGSLCISPRYERLVEAVLGTDAAANVEFTYPSSNTDEEAAIADTGLGVYLTMTGSTARDHGLVLGEHLFPSETVLMENRTEVADPAVERVMDLLADATAEETAIQI